MPQSLRNSPPRGFSLIELMVAMLIGLIGMVIIFQVFEVSEGIKRSTTSGGDAQQNGAIALYVMERDLRSAGMGFNDTPYVGCKILAYDSLRKIPGPEFSTAAEPRMALVPALICVPGSTAPGCPVPPILGAPATTPDQLTVFYGSQPQIGDASPLSVKADAGNTSVQVTSNYAYRTGDLIVLNWSNQAPAVDCTLREVTGIASNTIDHKDTGTGYQTISGQNQVARFNRPGGLVAAPGKDGVVAYGDIGKATVARVINLGNLYEPKSAPNLPVYNTYAIVNNTLTVSSPFVVSGGVPAVNPIADNIVQMRVLYGLDDGLKGGTIDVAHSPYVCGDKIVDRFVTAATFDAIAALPACNPVLQTIWQTVIAVRIAIVARSALPEKPLGSDGTKCDATTDGTEATPGPDRRPRYSGGVIDVSASGDADATSTLHWKCYRYRVFETTVPLRNWIWRSS